MSVATGDPLAALERRVAALEGKEAPTMNSSDVEARVAALETRVKAIEEREDLWCNSVDTIDRRLRALEAATGVVVGQPSPARRRR